MNIYNDQKVATDRIGKKLEVKCDCPYCTKAEYEKFMKETFDKHFNFAEREEAFEDPYLEVERDNMRAIEAHNQD